MTFINLFAVGVGGFLGSIFRYLIGLIPINQHYPVTTNFINIFGSILIGYIFAKSTAKGLNHSTLVLFLQVGICGGFTTFSSFSLETANLLKNNQLGIAFLYILLSVSLSLGGVFLGMKIATN